MSIPIEKINKSIRTAIYFISSIQDSCDKHRVCLENRWFQEYTAYLADWKRMQNEIKKLSDMKYHEENSLKVDDIIEDLEELTLADSLLKKARLIRSKNQKINGFIDFSDISKASMNCIVLDSKSTTLSRTADKYKVAKKMPHSKSDFIASSNKSSTVKRSKSASVSIVPKENELSNNKKCSASTTSVPLNKYKYSNKASDNIAVISNKEHSELNRMCIPQVNLPISCDMNEKRNPAVSDSSEYNQLHHCSPTKAVPSEFRNFIKGKLSSTDFSFTKLKVWYPYISYKSEMFLTAVKCSKICTLHQTYSILHSIQETMMWIDLLYLIEKEVYPNLISCKKDVNVRRMCSYLLSLFHQTGQRIPILDPNG